MRLLIRLFLNLAILWFSLRRLFSLSSYAESSMLWTTGTTGDGTTTYTEAQSTALWSDIHTPNTTIANPHASQGVLPGVGGDLAVTGASSPVSVASGAAIVEGYPYRNTAAVSVTIPTPGAATRIDRIVLRVSHGTTRTVRITRIAGTEGAGAPSLTQTAGTTWDIPLAQASITTGGVITLTDQRSFCHFATRLDRNNIDGGASARIPFNDANGRLTDEAGLTYDSSGDRVRVQGGAPGYWLDETDGATKGALAVLDSGILQVQRRATSFGAAEATPMGVDIVNERLGVGSTVATAPRGPIHAYGTVGGFMFYDADAVAGSAVTIIPNGSGDVSARMYARYMVLSSGGGFSAGDNFTLSPGSDLTIYSSGSDIFNLRVNADGSVDVRRTGGSLTYKVNLLLMWF